MQCLRRLGHLPTLHVFHARLPTRQRLAQSVGRRYEVIGQETGMATQVEGI